MRGLKRENGGYTIETAVMMTIVFMVILLLITMIYIMYEQTRLNALAEDAAERAGVVYSVAGKDMIMGKIDPANYKDTSPYWRLVDFDQTNRKKAVQNYVLLKLNAYKLNENKYSESNVEVNYKNYFVYKRVEVKLVGIKFKVPFGGFLSLFIKTEYPIEASAEAAVTEQAEMIRNIDMVVDILAEMGLDGMMSKYSEKIEAIRNKISG